MFSALEQPTMSRSRTRPKLLRVLAVRDERANRASSERAEAAEIVWYS